VSVKVVVVRSDRASVWCGMRVSRPSCVALIALSPVMRSIAFCLYAIEKGLVTCDAHLRALH
jgi:hypothetical protein